MSRFFVACWKWYDGVLVRRPILSQSISTGVICSIGDVIAQEVIEKKGWKNYDFRRTLKFGAVGLFYVGPLLRFWYKGLDRIVPAQQNLKTAFAKMCLDQLAFAPPFIGSFLGLFAFVHSGNFEDVKKKLNKEYWNALTSNWKIWPAVQMITFSVIPLKMRVVFVQLVAVGWNTYLAWVANRD